MNWTQRILDFRCARPPSTTSCATCALGGSGDLNAVLATLNEGGLCRQAVDYWTGREWIVIAPQTPLLALTGPRFDRTVTLRRFCGEAVPAPSAAERAVEVGVETEQLEEVEEEHGDS
jgi:hypothetical protein